MPGREAARERGGRWRPASAEKARVVAGAPTEGAGASREGGCRSSAGEWGGMEEQGSRPPRARRHPPMRGLLELLGAEGRAPPWGALEVAGEEDRGGGGRAPRRTASPAGHSPRRAPAPGREQGREGGQLRRAEEPVRHAALLLVLPAEP